MSFAEQYKSALLQAIDKIDTGQLQRAIQSFEEARAGSKHILVCGKGGSASTAFRLACDIVKGASGLGNSPKCRARDRVRQFDRIQDNRSYGNVTAANWVR
jgi:hypothetical protein